MGLPGDGEAEIVQLQEFCGVDKHQATILLRKYATVEAAANAFFSDPVGALRGEAPQNEWEAADNLPAFAIEAEDTINIPSMSRPPSRVGVRPGADTAGGQQFGHQVYAQDDDLHRAIAMSKQSMPAQESGVTSGQQFGPANRSYYDPNQWAVTAVSSSREIVEHPRPLKRRRIAGQPAFLRGSRETGYLAPLLNIYHSIPLARHAFLFPSFRVLSYGSDPSWWAGTSDENNKSLSLETSDDHDLHRHNLLAEVQCLMAFLDTTERAYGSVDALFDLHALKTFPSETTLSRLVQSWVAAGVRQSPDEQLTQIFSSEALRAPSSQNLDYDRKEFQVLEAPVEHATTLTLIDLMDRIIWDDLIDKVDDVWMERTAQVFTMRVHGSPREGGGLGLEVPAVWYPERYMSSFKEPAREMRIQMLNLQRQVHRCGIIQRRCLAAQSSDKRMIKIREVLEAASQLSSHMATAKSQQDESTSSPTEAASNYSGVNIESELQAIVERIDQKVAALDAQKQELRQEMQILSQSLSRPEDGTSPAARLTYVLQGVSTKPNITYVRIKAGGESNLIDLDETTPHVDEWQWWRFEWREDIATPPAAPDTPISYSIQQVTEAQVLNAAQTEHDSVLLVYADQEAISHDTAMLTTSLRKFVEQDNRAFHTEVEEEMGTTHRPPPRATVSAGVDDIGSEDDHTIAYSREMTPMSTSSVAPDKNGVPSSLHSRSTEGSLHDQHTHESPPPYEDLGSSRLVATQPNKIGLLADQMLDRLDQEPLAEGGRPVHIEHATKPLR